MAKRTTRKAASAPPVETYRHTEAHSVLRPDVGTQAQFRKKKPPRTYRYDSSLSPALDWDGSNASRELGEWLIGCIERASRLPSPHVFPKPQEWKNGRGQVIATVSNLQEAVAQLARLSRPFLDWAGKAERLSFDVPTLPLFVHERLSTKAILETLKGHKRDKQLSLFDLFGDPQHTISDQVLRAYEHQNGWTNRMILGDSLVVMNSLLQYEGLGGQVQMIYMDPPYGIQFGSNFQPFVRKRDVSHNDDEDMTREPEMVKAYRDTWELGLHSYLTYMRDRLLIARDLLTPSGSIFVQISDENVHHVRELMDEVFGPENFVSMVYFIKNSGATDLMLASVCDVLLWYTRDKTSAKYRQLFHQKTIGTEYAERYTDVELSDGTRRRLTKEELDNPSSLPEGARLYTLQPAVSQGYRATTSVPFTLNGKVYDIGKQRNWKTSIEGMERLAQADRLVGTENMIYYVRYLNDFPAYEINNMWTDTQDRFAKSYVVQTVPKVIQRCMLMTTDPGDLILDPTCGSGTTAYVAEQWGRRWITADVSRVPLALARQRLLTATFSYYELKDEARGPAGGFVYQRKQNKKGEQVGGIVPHVTLKSIANNEPSEEEVLVDRPEELSKITRITGPFTFDATIPTPVDWEGEEETGVEPESHGSFVDRMLEVLRQSPVLHVGGGKTVSLSNVRPPAKTLSLSAEALVASTPASKDKGNPVAIVFGPENCAVSEKLVYEAAREAHAKSYSHLYVIGFAIQPNARELVEKCEAVVGVSATYIQATPDLMMGDLLKNMRSSQIFSVCGLPEIRVLEVGGQRSEVGAKSRGTSSKPKSEIEKQKSYRVELLGLDVFDPVTMDVEHRQGNDVPAWLLDTDYNGLCFHVSQAFFPRTAAWDALKRALKGAYEDTVWDHLAGTLSEPFEAGDNGQVAVKVIDDRGNELLVVKSLSQAQKE